MVRLRKGKHKTWRKGQSCESNPATRKYRTAAKRGSITGRSTQNSNLTVEALAKHEERHDDDGDVELKEDEGFSVKSGQTFGAFSISGLTDCSNPVFATVKRFWDSPSSQHKEVSWKRFDLSFFHRKLALKSVNIHIGELRHIFVSPGLLFLRWSWGDCSVI